MWRLFLLYPLLLAAQPAFAQANTEIVQITEQQRDILGTAMKVDGELTADMHRRFWADMPKMDARQWREVRPGLERGFELDLRRMRAMYISIRATLRNHAVTIDSSYVKAQAEFEALRLGNALDDGTYQLKLALQDRMFRDQLASVARGEPLKRGDEDIEMTDELAAEVLDNIDAAYRRAERLLDPKWHAH